MVAWREGLGLVGVVLANVLATQAGLAVTTAALWTLLALGLWALAGAPAPWRAPQAVGVRPVVVLATHTASLALPWRGQEFRRLLALFMLNGVASAIPATLVIFFINDRVQAPQWTAVFLGAYFLMGAASVHRADVCADRGGVDCGDDWATLSLGAEAGAPGGGDAGVYVADKPRVADDA